MDESDPLTGALFSARAYVPAWLLLNEISVKHDGELADPRQGRTRSELMEAMTLDSIDQRRAYNRGKKPDYKAPSLEPTELEAALNKVVFEERKRLLMETRARLKCDTEDLEPIRQMLRCIIRSEPTHLDVLVVAQWILNVKRRMFGFTPLWWHTMVLWTGKVQGSGKTTILVDYLLAPVSHYTNSGMPVDEALDSRSIKQLNLNYVMFFDEMSGVHRADIERLKNIITSNQISYRPMYSNHVEKLQNNASFMGASNNTIGLLLNDRTGMRRFYEIKCPPRCDITAAEQIDYWALWRGVDENKISYLEGNIEALRAVQAEYQAIDEVGMFVETYGLTPEPGAATVSIDTRVLYGDYSQWCRLEGHTVLQANFFGKKLATMGVAGKHERVKPTGRRYVYEISEAGHQRLESEFRRK